MHESHIIFAGHEIVEVRCKLCNTTIRGLVVDDAKSETVVENGKKVVYQRLRLCCFANYAEVEYEVKYANGLLGKHTTSLCKSCAGKIISLGEATALMQRDIENTERHRKLNLPSFRVIRRL